MGWGATGRFMVMLEMWNESTLTLAVKDHGIWPLTDTTVIYQHHGNTVPGTYYDGLRLHLLQRHTDKGFYP